ncbi:SMI1/KNR4 family protein [Kitasatospora sp. NPDC001603]|uniref:SMI1/KNR4 family protein n=1 Tax=Kitasatospora sp. NPDC001603 TaxID=3154388 RepID=UPI00332796AA
MDSTAHIAVIEDLLAGPLPDEGSAQEGGREDHRYHLVHLAAGDRGPEELNAVVVALGSRLGPPKTVALDGFMDPSLRCLPGPPLVDVLASQVIEMYGWTVGQKWLGVGLLKGARGGAPDLAAVVNALGILDSAAPVTPAESPRAEDLVALTGWRGGRRKVDWAPVERKLGVRLPQDYKLLAETFGAGTFDDTLDLCVPGPDGLDLGLIVADTAEFSAPAPSSGPTTRLLEWATADEHSFCWLVEDPDPEAWPVYARADKWDPWKRFDCSSTEFIHRMLTDPQHPYSLADYFETHWFTSVEQVEQAKEAFWDEYYPHP